jgi:hypothetical protein
MTGRGYLRFVVITLFAMLCLSCGKDSSTGPDGAPLFKVELEHYSSSFDDEASQFAIQRAGCQNASNDSTVFGLDISGEWIMVDLYVPEDGTYRPYLDYASEQGAVITLRLEMDACGTSNPADFLLTDGTGIG